MISFVTLIHWDADAVLMLLLELLKTNLLSNRYGAYPVSVILWTDPNSNNQVKADKAEMNLEHRLEIN